MYIEIFVAVIFVFMCGVIVGSIIGMIRDEREAAKFRREYARRNLIRRRMERHAL